MMVIDLCSRSGRVRFSVEGVVFVNKKYMPYVFTVIMALGMEFFMSFFVTSLQIGFKDGFLLSWAKLFAVGFPVALPVSFVVAAFARRVVSRIFGSSL